MVLELNNLQWLICHETKPNQTFMTSYPYFFITAMVSWFVSFDLKKKTTKKQKIKNILIKTNVY